MGNDENAIQSNVEENDDDNIEIEEEQGNDDINQKQSEEASENEEEDDEDEDVDIDLDVDSMTVNDLKNELRSRGLKLGGKKAELKQRLIDALADDDTIDID